MIVSKKYNHDQFKLDKWKILINIRDQFNWISIDFFVQCESNQKKNDESVSPVCVNDVDSPWTSSFHNNNIQVTIDSMISQMMSVIFFQNEILINHLACVCVREWPNVTVFASFTSFSRFFDLIRFDWIQGN